MRYAHHGSSVESKRYRRCGALLVMFTVAMQACHTMALASEDDKVPNRPLILVPLADAPSWQDMALLAAVPAASVANKGKPAVIALPESGEIGRETEDYLRRYRPTIVYSLGRTTKTPADWRTLSADSASAASCVLAQTFWQSSETVVICPADDYSSALVASTLAARLDSPLLFCSRKGISAGTTTELERLGAKKAIVIGLSGKAATAIKKRGAKVTKLADAKAVLTWMHKKGLDVSYIAAVNPDDRSETVIRKLSLAGALLAAGWQGMAIPLAYDVMWKRGFTGEPCEKDLPEGIPANGSKTLPRKGLITLDGKEFAFITTGGVKAGPHRLYVDLNGNGSMSDPGEGPLATADTVNLAEKDCVVTLGENSGVGKADLRLTYPSAQHVRDDLKTYYALIGKDPEYLCLVGFPESFPQAVLPREPGRFGDLLSDLPYADTDDDPFVEVAVARLIAENASLATLHASRVLTYDDLLDPEWQNSIAQARWENTYGPLFENVGFTSQFRHDKQDLKWIVEPNAETNERGRRAPEFDSESPLTRVAAITHMAHSWWKDLGQTYSWDATALVAPMLVESGGCLTATLDREPDFRSVIARLFRNGAVAFVGNIRPGMANQEQQRAEFWNGVLAGQTVGQAHRRAQNSMLVTVLDNKQLAGGYHHYSLSIRALFGDPAFTMRVPSSATSTPAKTTQQKDIVSVHAPGQWWPVSIRVPEDWKLWCDKGLYVCRGSGTYPVRHWCREQYDREETYCNAEIRTDRRIESLTQVQSPVEPLGWNDRYWVDEHADGTRTYRWRVRLIDFDQTTGKTISKVDRLDYRIKWQSN